MLCFQDTFQEILVRIVKTTFTFVLWDVFRNSNCLSFVLRALEKNMKGINVKKVHV